MGNVTELPSGFVAKTPSLSTLMYFLEMGRPPTGAGLVALQRSCDKLLGGPRSEGRRAR